MGQALADTAAGVARYSLPRCAPAPGQSRSVDVSRAVAPWRWWKVLLAPVELLGLAWTAPLVILLLMVPIGLALAGALWVGRLLLPS